MEQLKEIDEINKDIRDKELKEKQLQHRLKLEQSKVAFQKRSSNPEYRARTNRLCNKGGTIEHFYPDTKELTAEEFYELLDMLDHDLLIRQSWLKNVKEIMERREEVESQENRKDAQLAYSFDVALQNELTIEENKEILLRFLDKNFISRGMICDVAIHDPPRAEGEERNLHAHFLCPMRPILENGEWGAKREHIPVFDKDGNPVLDKKGKQKMDNPFTTDWGKAETLEEWRENWEYIVNGKFREKGLSCRIDHRSNADRGIDDIPQVHEGSAVRRMEKRGIVTYKGSWNRWVKKTNDNIHRLLNKIRELAVWITEAKEKVRRIENPTITDMVMQYYEHRDEVAEGYSKGIQTAKKGNLKLASEMIAYIQQNNLTDIDALEALITKKDKELSDSKTGLDDKKNEVREIKKGLRLMDDYYDNKAVYDASQQIFFKAKKHEYQEAHRPELNKFYKARRRLKEMGHEEADYDVVKNYWEARLETLKQEIADETKEINDSVLGRKVKMLSLIKEAVDFATKDDDDDDENGDNGGTPAGGGQAPQMESEAEKKAKEEAAMEAAMSAKPVIKAEPQVKGDEEPLSVNAHGRHIFMHISGIDIKMLSAAWTPKYYSDSAGRRRFHILRKDRFMLSSSVIEPDDYTVFAENGRILLQKVS